MGVLPVRWCTLNFVSEVSSSCLWIFYPQIRVFQYPKLNRSFTGTIAYPMRLPLLLLLFAFFFTGLCFSQEGPWHLAFPKPQGNHLNDIQFVNPTTGWAVGNYGTILKTTNNGANWNVQSLSDSIHFLAVQFTSSSTGWVCGTKGTILKTTDGGENWQAQNIATIHKIADVSFTDSLTGWAIADSLIFKTTNGGASWAIQSSAAIFMSLLKIKFINSETGWMLGGYGLFQTLDGGLTWQPNGPAGGLSDMQFTDSLNGWACGGYGALFKTEDGGQNWISLNTISTKHYKCLSFLSASTGALVYEDDGDYIISMTTNGGETWNGLGFSTIFTENPIYSIQLKPDFQVVVAGTWGYISSVNNPNWNYLAGGSIWPARAVSFANEEVGWVVSDHGYASNTTNGGQTWKSKWLINSSLRDVYFIDPQNGWILTGTQKVLRTSNGGQTWEPLELSPTTTLLYGMQFLPDGLTGWVVGSGGKCFKTTDGGLTWDMKAIGNGMIWQGMCFPDAKHGWISGANGIIRHTSDGGETWAAQNSGTTHPLTAVYFADSLTGWAVGGKSWPDYVGIVLKTTNGGQSWALQHQTNKMLYSLIARDRNQLWVAGQDGIFLESNDGGATWKVQTHSTKATIFGMGLSPAGRCWAVGNGRCTFYSDGTEDCSANTSTQFILQPQNQSLIPGQSARFVAATAGSSTSFAWEMDAGSGFVPLANSGQFSGVFTDTLSINPVSLANHNHAFRCVVRQSACRDTSETAFLSVVSGVNPPQSEMEVSIFPNPAEQWVSLKTLSRILAFHVTDLMGRTLDSSNFAPPAHNQINISGLLPGVYYVHFQTSEGTRIQKFIRK